MVRAATTDEIVTLEREYWQALKDADAEAALALTHDPCVVAGPQGAARYDHTQMRAMSGQKKWRTIDFEMDEPEVEMVGDSVGELGYTITLHLELSGQPHSMRCAESSTWVRTPDGWRCVLHSETPLGDPFGRQEG